MSIRVRSRRHVTTSQNVSICGHMHSFFLPFHFTYFAEEWNNQMIWNVKTYVTKLPVLRIILQGLNVQFSIHGTIGNARAFSVNSHLCLWSYPTQTWRCNIFFSQAFTFTSGVCETGMVNIVGKLLVDRRKNEICFTNVTTSTLEFSVRVCENLLEYYEIFSEHDQRCLCLSSRICSARRGMRSFSRRLSEKSL